MLQEVYGSPAPFKSGQQLMQEAGQLPILSDEEIRQRMSDIQRRYPAERKRLRAAYEALRKVEHRTHLAITFKQPALLKNKEARAYLEKALEDKLKITESDKDALKQLEDEELTLEYDLAKFDCETTDKDHAKLEKLLSYAQSEMKLV